MTRLILSTSNIVSGGPPVIRRPTQKSNVELVSGLQGHIAAARRKVYSTSEADENTKQPNGEKNSGKARWRAWSIEIGGDIHVPSADFSRPGLAEERSSYEVTVKLFFLPGSSASNRPSQTREAIGLVLRELQVESLDLLVISYPGVVFDAEELDAGVRPQEPQNGHAVPEPDPENLDTMMSTWENLEAESDKGVIRRLGVAEFDVEKLDPFLKRARIKPSVNQINVRDACIVPRELITYAKEAKIDLLTHNDCTNILPQGTLRALLGPSEGGAGILSNEKADDGLKGDVQPQWVVKYTAIVQNRGVIENKGYFAMAEVVDSQ